MPSTRVTVTLTLLLAGLACTPQDSQDSAETWSPVPWSAGNPPVSDLIGGSSGLTPARGIIHLHSPWSHDACDGDPLPDGSPDPECLAALRQGLCATRMNYAYLTDHPDHAAWQDWGALFHAQEDDRWAVNSDGQAIGIWYACGDSQPGHEVLIMPGIEDELMPLGHEALVAETSKERHAIFNQSDAETVQANRDAGALVFLAHTEGRELKATRELVQSGVQGIEIFNLHAMFDPEIRTDDLGLDAAGWLGEVSPFTSNTGTAEPDLLFLSVLMEQAPSILTWDSLLSEQPVVGIGGTDAHQNVLDVELRDGERMDSYRRMMRWFSNLLLLDPALPESRAQDDALQAGRVFVIFDILGMPTNLDFALIESDGRRREMGSTGPGGILQVSCPTLSSVSPQTSPPEPVSTTVFKDGSPWADTCGSFAVKEAGSYRVRYDIIPKHLNGFLGDDSALWMQSYPWIYSNPIFVSH